MKRFKPFTPSYEKKTKWADYRCKTMTELAEINGQKVDLKEKYGRMDATMYWNDDRRYLLTETMEDYEAMSENSCMYCNKYCKQYRTHEDSWTIHLCLPCLIGDKVTILLERIIRRWEEEKRQKRLIYLIYTLGIELLIFFVWVYLEIEYGKGTAQLPSDVYIRSELLNTGNSINK